MRGKKVRKYVVQSGIGVRLYEPREFMTLELARHFARNEVLRNNVDWADIHEVNAYLIERVQR